MERPDQVHSTTHNPATAAETREGRVLAALAHLGILVFAVVVPGLLFFTVGKKDSFVRRHSAEAFNFQVTFLALWVGAVLVLVATSFAGRETPALLLPLMLIALTSAVAVSVAGAVRALLGRSWRYFLAVPILGAEGPGPLTVHSARTIRGGPG